MIQIFIKGITGMTPLLHGIWILSSKNLNTRDLESSEGSFTPMSGPWAGRIWWQTAKQSTTHDLPMWRPGFLTAWQPFTWQLSALGLSLLVKKEKAASPFLLNLGSHIVSLLVSRFKRGNQPPPFDQRNVTLGDGKQCCGCLWETQCIIFLPSNGI